VLPHKKLPSPPLRHNPGQPVPAVHGSGKEQERAQVHDRQVHLTARYATAPGPSVRAARHDNEDHEGECRKGSGQGDEPGEGSGAGGIAGGHEWVLAVEGDRGCGGSSRGKR
jgi:hypothetical protein